MEKLCLMKSQVTAPNREREREYGQLILRSICRQLSKTQVQYSQDTMVAFVNEDITEPELLPISVNYRKISSVIDIALTCMARDWRGFGSSSEMSNGVLTWQKE